MNEQRAAQAKLAASVYSLAVLYRLVDQVARPGPVMTSATAAVDSIVHAFHIDRASVLLFDEQGVMRFVCWRGLSDTYRQKMEGHSPWTADADDPQPIFIEDVAADPSMAPLREAILAEGIRALAFIPLVFQARLLGKFMVYFPEVRAMNTDERLLAETIGRHVGFGLARMGAEEAATHALAGERAARAEADRALAEAEQASKAKDEFLAMLAHELRNPLGVIVHATRVLTARKMVTPEGAFPPGHGRAPVRPSRAAPRRPPGRLPDPQRPHRAAGGARRPAGGGGSRHRRPARSHRREGAKARGLPSREGSHGHRRSGAAAAGGGQPRAQRVEVHPARRLDLREPRGHRGRADLDRARRRRGHTPPNACPRSSTSSSRAIPPWPGPKEASASG
jgi:hypothetical protein